MEKNNNTIKEISQKIHSPLFSLFIIYFILWNWKVFYITFFVSEKNIINFFVNNKLQYINMYYGEMTFWEQILQLLILPTFSLVVSAFIISKFISPIFYRNKIKILEDNEIYKIDSDIRIENKKKERLNIEKENLSLNIEKADLEKKVNSYNTTIKEYHNIFSKEEKEYLWEDIKTSIYEDGGRYYSRDEIVLDNNSVRFNTDDLIWLEKNGIIKLNNKTKYMKLTDKGAEMLKIYEEFYKKNKKYEK